MLAKKRKEDMEKQRGKKEWNFLNGKIKAHILGKDEAGNEDLCADLEIDLVVP